MNRCNKTFIIVIIIKKAKNILQHEFSFTNTNTNQIIFVTVTIICNPLITYLISLINTMDL
jgi:hypothetical protein